MRFERTINLRITDWPRFCLETEFPLDADIFPDEQSLRRYVRNRFGEGTLRKIDENRYEYQREIPGPRWWWRLLAFILNRSYA